AAQCRMPHPRLRVLSLTCAASLSVWFTAQAVAQSARTVRDIVYATVDDRALGLDLYLPADRTNAPLVVWVHGGAWTTGTKAQVQRQFVEHGYATASIDFRQSTDA